MDTGPALVSILRQGTYLIASIHTALDDSQMVRFQQDLIDQIGMHRSGGVIIDLAALDVLDSFGSRTLRNIGETARLRGAVTVLVGIQPDVAFAMVELGLHHSAVHTALDLTKAQFPYPCLGHYRFLDIQISKSSAYSEIVHRLRSGQCLLDVGCCVGQELRQLVSSLAGHFVTETPESDNPRLRKVFLRTSCMVQTFTVNSLKSGTIFSAIKPTFTRT